MATRTTDRAGRRLSRSIQTAWVLVLAMLLIAAAWSLSGQLQKWGMPDYLAWPLSIMFDAAGLICATYARRAVERGTPAAMARLSLLGFVTVAGILNWNHGHDLGGRPAAAGFAALSAGVELLFELHRRDVRDEQRAARGLIAERLPHIPALGWIMYPKRSWNTLRAAVGARLDRLDPIQQTTQRVVVERIPSSAALPGTPALTTTPQPPSEPAGPDGERIHDVASLIGHAHAPIVYFIRNGSRIKIGTTQNLKRRLAALTLRPDDVMRAEHGAQRHERILHARFAEQRAGNTEWFDLAGPLAQHLGITDASSSASSTLQDAPSDTPDTQQVSATIPSTAVPTATASKSALILAASSALHPGASAADIAHHLAQQGCAVDTAYVRTVLSRAKKPSQDDGVGKGGGGYA